MNSSSSNLMSYCLLAKKKFEFQRGCQSSLFLFFSVPLSIFWLSLACWRCSKPPPPPLPLPKKKPVETFIMIEISLRPVKQHFEIYKEKTLGQAWRKTLVLRQPIDVCHVRLIHLKKQNDFKKKKKKKVHAYSLCFLHTVHLCFLHAEPPPLPHRSLEQNDFKEERVIVVPFASSFGVV